ncbi:cupin domain-containing protein [Hyphomonas sp.]|jgi:quercetin dioxygenase-like cupin family protein|uniref:cupin domain-containing protein n=1 Tax=Hyphomonas sp. TaxID=87 RepID=UPI00243A1A02|nr:cupin domain-containing protein [Hyphomonas sp.]
MSNTLVRSDLFMHSPRQDAEKVAPGIHRKLLGYDSDLMLVKVWFDKGAVGEVHAHPHTQTAYVVEGKFEVYVDGRTEVLEAGGCFFVPSGAEHGAVCLEEGILLDIFTPARMDFLGQDEGW